ncbi:Acetyltransferase (GNAT) domain protein [uncultured archaeon]|nr:Acetyltransferase (GNAT) domain protein [uncultured archaeon]
MSLINPNELKIQQLAPFHEVSSFDCANADLNDFIKNDALKQQAEDQMSKTYLVICGNKIVGFFTLLTDTIKLKKEERTAKCLNAPYAEFPAVKIGRLGIIKEMQHKGLGKLCIQFITGQILESFAGSRFITTDAYPNSAGFYEKLGFVRNLHHNYKPSPNSPTISLRFDLKSVKPD